MKIDLSKMDAAMAAACMDAKDLRKAAGIPEGTYGNIRKGLNVRTSTAGKVARALNVPVTDILADEDQQQEWDYQKELDSKVKMIVRYTELAVRLSEYSMKNREWKPEYKQDMESIKAELLQLRTDLGLDAPERMLNKRDKR